ncbi:MAG: hypothetical protein IKD06_00690 [Clostridia bacterium]|nr:hypothetical protein [Clostridia bacterium]
MKHYLKFVPRLCMYHLLGIIFGAMMLIPTSVMSEVLFAGASLIAVFLYLFLHFGLYYDCGAKDRSRIASGVIRKNYARSLLPYAMAQCLVILATVAFYIAFLSSTEFREAIAALDYNSTLSPADLQTMGREVVVTTSMGKLGILSNGVLRILQMPYLGLLQTLFLNNPFRFLIVLLPMPIVSVCAYSLGINDTHFMDLFRKKEA